MTGPSRVLGRSRGYPSTGLTLRLRTKISISANSRLFPMVEPNTENWFQKMRAKSVCR